jgi:hypothetical protein
MPRASVSIGRNYEREDDIEPPAALVHAIVALTLIGYAQNYYFHLRELGCSIDMGDP